MGISPPTFYFLLIHCLVHQGFGQFVCVTPNKDVLSMTL